MKPAEVKSSTYIYFGKENNKEDPKFEVGNHVRMPKYKKKNLRKVTLLFGLKTHRVPLTYVISNLTVEKIVGLFCEKKMQKTNETKFRV